MRNMRKRITSILLAVVMLFSMAGQVVAASPFTDLTASWYKPAVEWAYGMGIVAGMTETTFGPNENVTRGMLVTMLYRIAEKPSVTQNPPFSDVPGGQWYSDAVTWASSNRIVAGYDNGKFGLYDNITRQDIVTILYRYAGSPNFGFNPNTMFRDVGSASGYAQDAILWAKANDIVSGKGDNMFAPRDYATRAEVVQILYKYFGSSMADGHTHVWETKTVHHDAVTGTRIVTKQYIDTLGLFSIFHLTQEGVDIGLKEGDFSTLRADAVELGLTELVRCIDLGYVGTYDQMKARGFPVGGRWDICSQYGCMGHMYLVNQEVLYDPDNPYRPHIDIEPGEVEGSTPELTLNWDNDVTHLYHYCDHISLIENTYRDGSTGKTYCEEDSFTKDIYLVAKSHWDPKRNDMWLYIAYNWDSSTYGQEYFEKTVGAETYVITDAYDETVTTCTICGVTDHTHNYTSAPRQILTCTNPGLEKLTCTICKQSHVEGTPAKGHCYESGAKEYNWNGVIYARCSNCGKFIEKSQMTKVGE